MFLALIPLFKDLYGCSPEAIEPIAPHASQRQIARLRASGMSVCGVINEDVKENEAFIYFAEHFSKAGINVPVVYKVSADRKCYLVEDLGDTTLYQLSVAERGVDNLLSANVKEYYAIALEELAKIQIVARIGMDFTRCYPKQEFDRASMCADMEYFRDKFLSRAGIAYSPEDLKRSFDNLATALASSPCEFFMYRDFQARNIMVKDGKLYFIDFQGGRKGPLQYDVVSLLYQASAKLDRRDKDPLLNHYIEAAGSHFNLDKGRFIEGIPLFVLVRMLQVLGTYGKVGLEGGKSYFQKSIPLAADNLKDLLASPSLWRGLDELKVVVSKIVETYGQ